MRLSLGQVEVDTSALIVVRDGKPLAVEPKVFDLLLLLVTNRDRIVSRSEAIETIWSGRAVSEDALSSCLKSVRRVVGDNGRSQRMIRTAYRRGFQWIGPVQPLDAAETSPRQALSEQEGAHRQAQRSIAVLPFVNLSGDAEQAYFVDGLVDDIITALARFKSLLVIARSSSFTFTEKSPDVRQVGRDLGVRYILRGSVRKSEFRLRITAQLVDCQSGSHVWADRLEGSVNDVFDLQDRITETVVTSIAPRIEAAEMARARRRPSASLDAYDLYLRGVACLEPMSRHGLTEAPEYFRRAITIDPDFAAPYGMAIGCIANRRGFGLGDSLAKDRADVSKLIRKALRVALDDSLTLSNMAWASAYILRDLDAARDFVDRALTLNPSLAQAWAHSAWINLWLGDAASAKERLSRSMRLDPVHAGGTYAAVGMAHACFFLGCYLEAEPWIERQLQVSPDAHGALRIGAANAALAGQIEKARRLGRRLAKVDSAFRVSRLRDYLGPYKGEAFVEKYAKGLRCAGLPM